MHITNLLLYFFTHPISLQERHNIFFSIFSFVHDMLSLSLLLFHRIMIVEVLYIPKTKLPQTTKSRGIIYSIYPAMMCKAFCPQINSRGTILPTSTYFPQNINSRVIIYSMLWVNLIYFCCKEYYLQKNFTRIDLIVEELYIPPRHVKLIFTFVPQNTNSRKS